MSNNFYEIMEENDIFSSCIPINQLYFRAFPVTFNVEEIYKSQLQHAGRFFIVNYRARCRRIDRYLSDFYIILLIRI